MNLAWMIAALALVGADEPQSSKPQPPSAPFTIEIKIGGPSNRAQASPREAVEAVATTETGIMRAALVGQTLATFPENRPSTCPASPTHNPSESRPAQLSCSPPPMVPPKAVEAPKPANDSEARELWPMLLSQAIRISLDNCEIVRVIAFGAEGIPIGGFEPNPLEKEAPGPEQPHGEPAGPPPGRAPIVIARLNADASEWRFKAELMAHIRSVEQTYWNLAQAHVALWSRRTSSQLGGGNSRGGRGRVYGLLGAGGRRRRGRSALGTVQPRTGHASLRRDHDRAAIALHPRPAAGRQPADHPRHSADRAADRL